MLYPYSNRKVGSRGFPGKASPPKTTESHTQNYGVTALRTNDDINYAYVRTHVPDITLKHRSTASTMVAALSLCRRRDSHNNGEAFEEGEDGSYATLLGNVRPALHARIRQYLYLTCNCLFGLVSDFAEYLLLRNKQGKMTDLDRQRSKDVAFTSR